jgi:hypothetical protein
MYWYNPKRGRKREVSIGYQVLVAGEWKQIVRYDSDHSTFHRHACNYPEAGIIDKNFGPTPMEVRFEAALTDILENAKAWQRVIPRELLEAK